MKRSDRGMRRTSLRVLGTRGVLVVIVLSVSGACGGDRFADYCDEVADQQLAISNAVGAGGPTALIEALPSFRELRQQSPSDIRDEWDTVVTRIDALVEALDRAEVDPMTYSADDVPEGLSEQDQAGIEAAADQLTSQEMVSALNGVQQQARDVCKTPLSI